MLAALRGVLTLLGGQEAKLVVSRPGHVGIGVGAHAPQVGLKMDSADVAGDHESSNVFLRISSAVTVVIRSR